MLRVLILVSLLVVICSCESMFNEINNSEQLWSSELGLERGSCISCLPSVSEKTLEKNQLTFNIDHILCIHLSMESSDFEQMREESRFGPTTEKWATLWGGVVLQSLKCDAPYPSQFNWYSGNISIDGLNISNVGIRKKGFLGSIFSEVPSIKIVTNKYVKGQYLGTTKNITLNNNAQDTTRVTTCLNARVFELAGYPAPRCNLASVTINGQSMGAYSHLETIDRDFLIRQFGNDNGHLYEGQLVDFWKNCLPRWEPKTKQTNSFGKPLLAMIKILDQVTDELLVEKLSEHLNIKRFITFWALEIILGHNDGYTSNQNNFFIYLDPNDNGRITFIPWGFENGSNYESEWSVKTYFQSRLPNRLSQIPEVIIQLENEMNLLLKQAWNEAYLVSLIDDLSIQVKSTESSVHHLYYFNKLKAWIPKRRAEVEILIQKGLPRQIKK